MNLTRALDVALPDIPARAVMDRVPRIDPETTFREHLEDGAWVVRVYTPSSGLMYRLTQPQWNLARLFDGNRSYQEIAELYSQESGEQYDEQSVSEFAAELEAANFWYRTAQEKNVLLLLQSKDERRKNLKAKHRYSDLSMIMFPAFNPDPFLNWLYPKSRFIYTTWFTVLTVLLFLFTAVLTVSHWPEIGRDTAAFYSFSGQTFADVAVLWLLGMFVVGMHEFAHAHACKHAGGRVTSMGFALIYLTPAFYTDTTEGAVMGTRSQRLVIALGGIWVELILCSIATPIWWLTAPDTVVHEGAYFMMMLTGIVSLVVNWNPLIKLDGYYMLCEILGIAQLKEDSTAYLSAWIRRHVWHLAVDVPYVPKGRRLFYAVYALASGAYSYTVLAVVVQFTGNVAHNFTPDWSFIPEYGVALLVFRSRIRLLVNFMKLVYLDKKDRALAWLKSKGLIWVGSVALVFLFLPVWHESTSGRFVLEPGERAVVRAEVPGVVEDVFVSEGALVEAGSPLARLRNMPLQAEAASAHARYTVASGRVRSAEITEVGLGAALQERQRLAVQDQQQHVKAASLLLTSPISGTVVTARLHDKEGSAVSEGTEFAEVADLSILRARIYVSEYDMYKLREGEPAKLQVESSTSFWPSRVSTINTLPSDGDPSLMEAVKFKGLHPPQFYVVDLLVPNGGGTLKPGMTGVARIYNRRESLAGRMWEGLRIVMDRKIW